MKEKSPKGTGLQEVKELDVNINLIGHDMTIYMIGHFHINLIVKSAL